MSSAQQTIARISLADIAQLARVRRPVVSIWRGRFAGSDRPFPPPVETDGGRELFDAAAVADWLADTGRGNNPSAREDVAAFTTFADLPRDDRAVFGALTAALCLKVITGRRLGELDGDELLDLADEHDPDDELLYRECDAVCGRLTAVARYVDLLADAAISTSAAFESLLADRFRAGPAEHAATAVSPEATSLAAKIAVSLTDREGIPPVYVDPTGCSADLLRAVIVEHGEREPVEVLTAGGDAPAERLARRRLRVHDVYREALPVDADGAFAVRRAVTHVAQFPTPASPAMTNGEILAAVENIVVQMDDTQRGVVLAPATALCDGLRDRAVVALRADLLRAGHVRAIVRLPAGLVPARSRQGLALWVLGPSHHEEPAAERRTVLADLRDVPLSADVVDSLVTDLTAATGSPEMVRAHAFRFARPVPTRVLLAARRSLVDALPSRMAVPTADPASLVHAVDAARGRLSTPAVSLRLPVVAPGSDRAPLSLTTIGALLDARRLRLLPGNRIDPSDVDSSDGARVIGPPELLGERSRGDRRIPLLRLAERYDAARLTEPGDVVFCTTPRPAALVDHEGGSVVAFPARVLRVDPGDPGGVLPDVLAADIATAAPSARQWRTWPVRLVPDDQRLSLADALAALRAVRADALRRAADADELAELMIRAVTSGAHTMQIPARKGR